MSVIGISLIILGSWPNCESLYEYGCVTAHEVVVVAGRIENNILVDWLMIAIDIDAASFDESFGSVLQLDDMALAYSFVVQLLCVGV